jgi:hypothetical protein
LRRPGYLTRSGFTCWRTMHDILDKGWWEPSS